VTRLDVESAYVQQSQRQVADRLAIHWYSLAFGYGGEGVPHKSSISELESMRLAETRPDGTELALRYLPAGYGEGMVRTVVFFDPGINANPRSWTLRYTWAGMWEPLRLTGWDEFTLDLRGESGMNALTIWNDLTVTFVFPRPGKATLVAPAQGDEIREPEADGRDSHRFHFVPPERAIYKWRLGWDAAPPVG